MEEIQILVEASCLRISYKPFNNQMEEIQNQSPKPPIEWIKIYYWASNPSLSTRILASSNKKHTENFQIFHQEPKRRILLAVFLLLYGLFWNRLSLPNAQYPLFYIYSFIHLSIYSFIHLFIYLSTYLFIYRIY